MFNSLRLIGSTVAMIVLPAAFLAESAGARSAANEASVTVQYHDLDLGTERGVVSLYARIHAAAASVCKVSGGTPFLDRTLSAEEYCVNHALARAVRAVHNDRLSAYHWKQIHRWKYDRFDALPTFAAR